MDILTKFEENKRWNARFLRAFDYLCKEKFINQAQLAKFMGTNSSLISAYRNGTKKASEDIMQRLVQAYGGRLFMPYLTGESDYMLIESMSDEVFNEEQKKVYDPDYMVKKNKDMPSWADALLYRQTQQEKEMEELRRMIKATLEKVDVLTQKFDTLLRTSNYQIQTPQDAYLTAAEPK